uniref:Uncharacterized protein n=1 Tax=Oryza glumipatula TaxID=40148 RepID=A0A0E0BG84_9ORYZ
MEPPHLLRKGHLMPAILKAIASLDHKNLLKGTKIVKYLLACMPRPSTFFLDVSEQVYIGLVWSVQMCRSIDNRSTGLEFVSRGFIPTALTWEEEEANTLGQAGAGRKRLTGPRQKGGKEIGFPLQLMHLKETRRDLVENDRVLLNPAHSAQQEYERYVEILLSLFLS